MRLRPGGDCAISAHRVVRAARDLFRSLLVRVCWGEAILAFIMGMSPLTHAQVIQTVAGGASGSPAPSQNVCAPIFAAAAHGTDIYVVSCNRIYKVTASGSTWTLFAGNGIDGFSGDGGPATSASLGEPRSIVLDTAGNLYMLDTFNCLVREVSAAGIIQTIAGNGVCGFNGDNGTATFVRISGRGSLAVDSKGNVFLADAGNGRIREIANGMIQTVAGTAGFGFSGDGGLATSAHLSDPMGVFVDASGNIFIADTRNQRIREVVGGIINTIVGNGTAGFAGDGGPATSAELNYPFGVFVDGSGNIFVADTGNNRIRQITAGTITTRAGSGAANPSSCKTSFDQCLGDGGLASSAITRFPESVFGDSVGNLFILDGVEEIHEIPAGTTNIQIFAANSASGFGGDGGPALSAQLAFPVDAVADPTGNIYIADTGAVREVVAATGVIQTIAGKGVGGTTSLSGDNGPAASATTIPNGLAADANGNIYIADGFNEVREIVAATGTIHSVAGNGTAGYTGDGGPATSAQLNYPSSVFVDGAGNIFIADTNNSVIREVVGGPGGTIVTVAGNGTFGFSGDGGLATNAQLAFPFGVFVDASGNIFIADGNNVIREVLASTKIIQTVAGNGLNGFDQENVPATMATLSGLTGVFGDRLGNIYVPDFVNNNIRTFTVGGNIHTVVGNRVQGFNGDGGAPTNAELNSPSAVFVDPSGTLVIADTFNSRVRIVGPVAGFGPSPATMPTVTAGQSVTFSLTMFAASGSNLTFTMACLGLPANSACTFSPNPFAPGPPPGGSQVQLTFSTQAPAASLLMRRPLTFGPRSTGLFGFAGLLAAISGLVAWRSRKPKRRLAWGVAVAAVALAAAIAGCSGGGGSAATPSGGTPRGIANITASATSGSTTLTKPIAINVQ